MKNLLLFFLLLTTSNLLAQAPFIEWNKTNNNPNITNSLETPRGITATSDGGYVITGHSTQSSPYENIYNTKFDASGNIVWEKVIDLSFGYRDYAAKIRATADGGFINVGSTEEGGGPSFNYFNMFILKTNALGAQTWVGRFGNNSSFDDGFDIRELPDGSFIAVGNSRTVGLDITSNAGLNDLWAIKVSATGTKIWSKSYGTSLTDIGYGLIITNDGNCVIAGKTGTDGYIVKLNSTNGNLIWSKTIGGNNTDVLNSVGEDASGNLIFCGTTNSNTGFAAANRGLKEAWILKTNSTGDIIWNKIFGSTKDDVMTSLIVETDGKIVLVGNTRGNDGDVTGNKGASDEWIIKLDDLGTLLWQRTLGSTGDESGADLIKTVDGYATVAYTNQLNTNGDVLCPKGYFWTVKFNNSQPPPQGANLWLKADADVYSGGALAMDGEPVLNWIDQGCNRIVATQPSAANRPTWQQYAFNGKPALFFDGVNANQWLQNTAFTPVSTTGGARTYFVMAKASCNASGYTGGYLFSNRLTANASTLEFTKNGSSIFHGGNLCCNHPEATSVAFENGQNQPFIGTWRTGGTGTNLDFWFNGSSQTTANSNFVADNGIAGFAIGDRRDGQAPLGSYDWQGHIAEIIVYNKVLTDAERIAVENYLTKKYITSAITAQFTGLPITSITTSNTNFADATWKHTFNTSDNTKLIVSVKDNCLALGTINSTVYNNANATLIGGNYAMRRHYVVKPTLNPAGTKRIRLFYSNADFANLLTFVPTLTNASQLVVTKYSGANEDGVYNTTGGTLTLMPSSQITTGTSFGQNFLEFDVTSFSEFWIHTGLFVLPISLTSFTASEKNNTAILKWTTSSELNNKGYNIQHSIDGISFTNIGFIFGKGNSTLNTS